MVTNRAVNNPSHCKYQSSGRNVELPGQNGLLRSSQPALLLHSFAAMVAIPHNTGILCTLVTLNAFRIAFTCANICRECHEEVRGRFSRPILLVTCHVGESL